MLVVVLSEFALAFDHGFLRSKTDPFENPELEGQPGTISSSWLVGTAQDYLHALAKPDRTKLIAFLGLVNEVSVWEPGHAVNAFEWETIYLWRAYGEDPFFTAVDGGTGKQLKMVQKYSGNKAVYLTPTHPMIFHKYALLLENGKSLLIWPHESILVKPLDKRIHWAFGKEHIDQYGDPSPLKQMTDYLVANGAKQGLVYLDFETVHGQSSAHVWTLKLPPQ